jgi:hypothetical protein
VKSGFLGALTVLGLGYPFTLHAAAPDPCFTAPVEGQELRKQGKLLGARERFAMCQRKTCPSDIVEQCSAWANEVQSALPTVLLSAHDPSGHDLLDVRVSIDAKAPVDLGALPLELDPGPHSFVFQRAGSNDVQSQVLLREGEQRRQVAVEFTTSSSGAVPQVLPTPPTADSSRPVPTASWVLGGIGLLGLSGFATFGAWGVAERGTFHCDTGCSNTDKTDVATKYIVADVSLGAGIVALGIATWMYFARPSVEPSPAISVDFRAGAATIEGRF